MMLYLIIWFAATVPVGVLVGWWLRNARFTRVQPAPEPIPVDQPSGRPADDHDRPTPPPARRVRVRSRSGS